MHESDRRTQRELRLLRAYLIFSTAVLSIVSLAAFRRASDRTRFGEIDVERINVVEKDGRVRLVLANSQRSPGAVSRGQLITKAGGRPGLIFYNDEGDENGGLIFRGKRENGSVEAGGHLSFDRYGQDQVIALTYTESGGKLSQGLTILDRPPQFFQDISARRDTIRRMPNGPAKDSAWQAWALWQGGAPFGAPRLFVGRDQQKAAPSISRTRQDAHVFASSLIHSARGASSFSMTADAWCRRSLAVGLRPDRAASVGAEGVPTVCEQ